ncbi:Zn(2)-C6 fungal-type domain-containing protein [Fusarium falciforme]|uniref:Zn(2)-C6 fungal-type domain-containing protein n=1 Tax=Fusarium falciforme TaxID=195108 RepID=UPI00230081E6|nr:Zn(2)-C6 fungal-type domain-containing protein [Fusarium falciforme]WAO92720.1 Zn(2)-C6 fungal-type domain-containing protein [Fusarium falciforme]
MTRTSTTSKASGGSSAAPARRSAAGRPCKARSLACRECRDRKIRCDGARPVCDSCCRRGLGADQCVYPEIEHEGSIASSRSYIRALQKRVQELEEKEKQLELAVQGRDAFAATTPSHDDVWRKQSSSPGAVSEQPARPVKPLDHFLPPIHGDSSYPLSGFPAGAGSLPMAQEPAGYYSHPHHMGASPPLTDDLEEASHVKASSFGSYSSNVKAALMLEKISLPPTDLMDELLAEYFDVDWITLPAVHRPTFYQRYHRLIAVANSRYRRDIPLEEATELAATYSLLLGMLAIGQLTKSPAESTTSQTSNAYEFHQQARPLLLIDLLSVASLPVVQALIIHGRFLRRMGMGQESWMLTGMAHRLAEGMMLHVEFPGKSQAELEERRRTWCACALFLRTQNSPGSQTPANFGTLPQEIDDEYLETVPHNPHREQPSNAPSRISFFTQVLKLSDTVLQPVQDAYFNQRAGNKQSISEILGTALNLDCVLEEWQAALPEHLRLKFPCTQTEAVFRRQATLLRMRYLETKALISRAAIMKLVSSHASQPASMVARSMLSGLFESCYAASVELEDIMNRERRLVTFDGPPESHAVISLCIIGMTLTMLSKHPLFRDFVTNPNPINDEVRRCLVTARQYMTSHHPLAEKFIHALETALQPPSRGASSPGVLDPALESKSVGPVLSNLTENPGAVELEVLEAWYNREQGLASGCGMPVSEIVSLW